MRSYRAGDTVEDLCRACKIDRMHTVIVADAAGRPVRVQCDFCSSQHSFRGGADVVAPHAPSSARPAVNAPPTAPPMPIVTDRERAAPPIAVPPPAGIDLELLLRRVIREETGLAPAVPAEKWRGGTMVLRPANPALQDKQWPIETVFHKIVMIRNRLRTLEQQVNAMDLPEDAKLKMQGYITGCYGSLTSFNVLFVDEADQFKGSSSE